MQKENIIMSHDISKWKTFITEAIKFKRKRTIDKWGSENDKCDKPSNAFDLGKHIFHPFDPSRKTEKWECNTAIEDKLLLAIQSFIMQNDPDQIQATSPFILKYFRNKTDSNLPLSRMTDDITLYRGSSRNFDNYGIKFLNNVDWENPKGSKNLAGGQVWQAFPINAPYTLRRPVASFSYDYAEAWEFATRSGRGEKAPVEFIYQLNGKQETKGGGFFIDFSNFYDLEHNPHNEIPGESSFVSTKGMEHEQEALLIGSKTYDEIEVPIVWIHMTQLDRNLSRLRHKHPKLAEKIDYVLIFSPRRLEIAKNRFNSRLRRFSMYISEKIPFYFQQKNTEELEKLLPGLKKEAEYFLGKYDLYEKAVGKEALDDYIGHLEFTQKDIETVIAKFKAPARKPKIVFKHKKKVNERKIKVIIK